MTIQPLSFAVIVSGVGECIREQLLATPESGGVPPKMRLCYPIVGAVAADNCECGQLAVSIQRISPTTTFPVSDANSPVKSPCGGRSRFATVTASIFRCIPGMKAGGEPPACSKLITSALTWSGDEFAMRKGIECCLASYKAARPQGLIDYRVGDTYAIGPEGNCLGLAIDFSFQLP